MYFVIPAPFSLSFFCVFVFFFCSHWSLVDVPLIFFCPADHVPDWQPRILLGMVEARSVNVKKTTTSRVETHTGDEESPICDDNTYINRINCNMHVTIVEPWRCLLMIYVSSEP